MAVFGVAFMEGGQWVAHAALPIEHAAQAPTMEQAIRECREGITADMAFAAAHGSLHLLRRGGAETE